MVALKRERRTSFRRWRRRSLTRTRRSQRWKRRGKVKRHRPRMTTTTRRSPRLRPRRNVCIIKFPRRGYRMSCPLMTWCCDRWTRRHLVLRRKPKQPVWSLRGGSPRRTPLRLGRLKKRPQARAGRPCRDVLKATLREVARKKRPKRGLAAPKKRRRYSDDEIFYRMANPARSEDTEDGGSTMSTGDEGMEVPVSGRELREASS
ncbi:hypothetical protein JRQ81_007661 [Phrynocephalus forsythii]|uniref:Uncharacterized protein n=1 Tax=Phrynocephalus forsythii TaxID=171643 RepID=A0A9Q1AT96_9SAUR|nr:hypothetical protein JRQ81_007661 [Phrynocephalus forsythii]